MNSSLKKFTYWAAIPAAVAVAGYSFFSNNLVAETTTAVAGATYNKGSDASSVATDETKQVLQSLGFMVVDRGGLTRVDFSESEIAEIMVGMKKAMNKEAPPADFRQIVPKVQQLMQSKFESVQKQQQAKFADEAVENKAKGKAFLAGLESNPKVVKDEKGFYYEIIEPGEGAMPNMRQNVTVHYKGTLLDGTVFDSSYKRGQPADFPMGGVVPGFSGGLSKISKGGKVKIYIPSDLAYGDVRQGQIPAGSTLVFECELIAIK